MTTYYRVDLEQGIQIEQRPKGFYSKSPELNRDVFKNVIRARKHFDHITRAEIDRLNGLRKGMRGVSTRKGLVAALGHDGGDVAPDAQISSAQ